jgi:uncharacterized protein (TIGR00251 family)
VTGTRAPERETILAISVQPRASTNTVVGWTGETLKIKLTAPPVEGAANAACLAFLADLLDLPSSRLTLIRGERSRHKLVRIAGLTKEDVRTRLTHAASGK